ncbi:serine--tRNA ligase [Candidatus Liberibacter sp.]|uniref:serine--tRNA ligase n=1 Tax=Candidatus Liberibacter sp. TaxID=34022 RepID=UPI0015F7144E|nr:serine--tRNA ligase [Candidatus Liberibacter sp.]MBA5723808.1 serine--tRNA ligase [Candidatus Liberibacter sp.]
MIDIKWIRENPEALDIALRKRSIDLAAGPLTVEECVHRKEIESAGETYTESKRILFWDKKYRRDITNLEKARERRNYISALIGKALAQSDKSPVENLKAEIMDIKENISSLEQSTNIALGRLNSILRLIPNIPLDDVPIGKDAAENIVIRSIGKKPDATHLSKEHFSIGEALGLMDFERASQLSGARFSVLRGYLAHLERALGQFMLDLHTSKHGYTEISGPLLVNHTALYGTGQLPKFEEDVFKTTDSRYLIPTAEVILTNLVANEILLHSQLPLRFTSLSPCFRSEAGSYGRDTRGMFRQHQFWKCELVSITTEDNSLTEHERMISCAEEVLKKLELHYRVVSLCTGDLGFSAQKTCDLEVWLPGQKEYREISSCSICGDFQSKRMKSRYRRSQNKSLKFTHTLNGSGVATGRCLIAVLENYLNKDGSVTIPNVLRPYMGGLEKIEKPHMPE